MSTKKGKGQVLPPNIICFQASFSQDSPTSKVVILQREGGKLILEFPPKEAKQLLELYEKGMDKVFTVIIDIDNQIRIPELLYSVDKVLEEMKFNPEKFRKNIKEWFDIDTSDLTDDQIKALYLLSNIFEESDVKDVANFLGVSVKTINSWLNDEKFQDILQRLILRQMTFAQGLILKKIVQRSLKETGVADRKILANMLGLTKEGEINIIMPSVMDTLREAKDYLQRRRNLLFGDGN